MGSLDVIARALWSALLLCVISFSSPLRAQPEPIELWHGRVKADQPFLDKLFKQFTAETGIPVHLRYIIFKNLKVELIGAAFSNAMPDAIIAPADFLGHYKELKLPAIPDSEMPDTIRPRFLKTVELDGKRYGYPFFYGNNLMMFYNKSLVETPATSWKELRVMKPYYDKRNIELITFSYQEMYWLVPVIGAYGGWPLEGKKPMLNTPAVISAFKFYKGLVDEKLVQSDCNLQCSLLKFEQGKAAFLIDGTWSYKRLEESIGDDLGVAVLPYIDGKPMRPMYSSHVLAFPDYESQGEKQTKLDKLRDFIFRKDVQRQFYDEIGQIPTHKELASLVEHTTDPNRKAHFHQLEHARMMPIEPEMSHVWQSLIRGWERYSMHGFSAEESAVYMQKTVEREIERDTQ
ncbi:MAG: hypothetical protein CMF25_05825 [Kangiellaceae bacterium]|jgi:arabinogalactan oligomer/maltooligosaccharide transport system substrate-binding protein|nr:hypothetical protein [Kangiellaceae bacterium]|tara:strand:+ start:10317 stop:11525 length:1209 start_codon:yes stop_codon:yes gene_type:complete